MNIIKTLCEHLERPVPQFGNRWAKHQSQDILLKNEYFFNTVTTFTDNTCILVLQYESSIFRLLR